MQVCVIIEFNKNVTGYCTDSASILVLLPGGRRRKSKTTTSKKEEKLLRQLRQITQLMQEGRLEGASPEMEAEEVPYGADWEGTCLKLNPQAVRKILQNVSRVTK